MYHKPPNDEPLKLLLLNGNTLVEIADTDEVIKNKMCDSYDENFFNTFNDMPHLIQTDIGDSIY